VALSVILLAVSILAALWFASRIYAAGVLLYGQRPNLRSVLRIVRSGA
jgi:ABC-2 type transport system permease protein